MFSQEICLEFFPAGERTPEQLWSFPGRPRHIGGAHRQFGSDAHPAVDGRAEHAPRPEPEPEVQSGRRDRQENSQSHIPAQPVGRRTGVAHIGQPGYSLIPRKSSLVTPSRDPRDGSAVDNKDHDKGWTTMSVLRLVSFPPSPLDKRYGVIYSGACRVIFSY